MAVFLWRTNFPGTSFSGGSLHELSKQYSCTGRSHAAGQTQQVNQRTQAARAGQNGIAQSWRERQRPHWVRCERFTLPRQSSSVQFHPTVSPHSTELEIFRKIRYICSS